MIPSGMMWRTATTGAYAGWMCARVAVRRFASRSTSSSFSLVPFRLSTDDARRVFHDFFQNMWLAPEEVRSAANVRGCRAVFTPYWAYDVQTETTVEGDIGRRSPDGTKISFSSARLRKPIRSHYSSDLPEMQIYAGFSLKRANAQILKVPLSAVKPLSPSTVYGQEMEPFSMDRSRALVRVLRHVKAVEQRMAERELLRATGAAACRNVTVDVRVTHTWRRVYFPAYVFDYSHLGSDFTVVINGFNGNIFGLPQFSAVKVALAVAFPVTLILHSLEASLNLPLYVACVAIPSAFIGLACKFLPGFVAQRREAQRLQEQQTESTYSADFEEEWDSESRTQWDRREQRYQERYRPPPHVSRQASDLYDLIGVKRDASLADISRAFRAQALKYHPDVHANESDQAEAGRRFTKIVAAYQVLRDPVKRANYDRTGRTG